MVKRTVNLNMIENIKAFVNDVSKLDAVVDVVRGSYVVDGASLLGIMSFDLSKPVTAVLHTDNKEIKDQFNKLCDKYQ